MFRRNRRARGAGSVSEMRSFARSPQAVETLEKRELLAARIAGSAGVYATIQEAVNAAPIGATINVDAGVYSELVNVYKTVTIRGPRAGIDGRSNLRHDRAAEAVVNGQFFASGTRSTGFFLNADNIVLDGFTVEGQNSTNSYNAGIHFGAGRSGIRVLNNIVQHNATGVNVGNVNPATPAVIRGNLFRENNNPGPHSGRAIYSDGSLTGGTLNNVVIDNNVFFKNHGYDPNFAVQPAIGFEALSSNTVQTNIAVTNNVFDYNGKGVLIYNANNVTIDNNVFTHNRDTTSANLRFEGGMSNVAARNNLFYANGARAIRIDKKAFAGDNANFSINNNNFFGNGKDSGGQDTALFVDSGTYSGTLDATRNWWGAATGPSINTTTGSGDTIWTNGNSVNYSGWAATPIAAGSTLQLPYYATPLDVTSPIMFVDFDHGGQGVAHNDTTSANQGNILHRYQAVDMQASNDAGFGTTAGHHVGYVKAGEWLEYTINVPAAGTYDLQLRVANPNSSSSPGKFHVEVDGANVTGSVNLLRTGSWTTWGTQTVGSLTLSAGVHVLRFAFDANGSTGSVANFNWFQFVPVNVPLPPAAPGNLAASAANATTINLMWSDNATNETGFEIERSPNGVDGWIEVGTAGANATTFSNTTGLSPGATYFYRVRAINAAGASENSNVASATTAQSSTSAAYIANGSTWKYLDDGSNQGGAWTALAFDDSTWKSGAAQLGYGDGDEATVVSFGASSTAKYITTYFRKTFTVDDAALVTALTLKLLRDDGAVVYLNGTEVFRSNMPTGPVTHTTRASTFIGGADENAWLTAVLNPALLVSGTNVLAVSIHQDSPGSSDISFDAELTASLSDSPSAPAAPGNLAAAAAAHNQVNLTWSDHSTNETGFVIERSLNGVDGWAEIATKAADATSHSDTSVSASTQYFYRVRAVNAVGPSGNSNVAGATTPAMPTVPAAPSGLIATAVSATQIDLAWTDNADNETGFVIERSPNGVDGWAEIGTTGANVTAFNNTTGLSSGTQYFYRVRAINAAGASANSGVASATTHAAPTNPVFVAPGSTWKYLDNGSNQGTAWRTLGFNDSTWKSGVAQLGYGDGDEATIVSFGSSSTGKFITTYFRKIFPVADPAAVAELTMRLLRDDGAVVYLNGAEVYRNNMPAGTIGHTTRASSPIGGADENVWLTALLNPALLVAGDNVLAVSIHQDSPSSSDISFDLELTAKTGSVPTPVAPAAPTNLAAQAVSATQINLSWADNSNNETGFVIERSTTGTGGWIEIATRPADATTHFDASGLSPATQYFYRVRAVNGVGASADSNIASATTSGATAFEPTLIATGSTWKYLDNGSNQGTAWRAIGFNDSAWKTGSAEFGYGDGDEATVISYGSSTSNRFITTYFRKTIAISDPSAIAALQLRIKRDDGAVVYLNGTEVFRTNMPTGTISYTTRAASSIDDETFYSAAINPALLVAGSNVIAVEVHQSGSTSSDVSFDFELTATPAAAPSTAAEGAQPPATSFAARAFSTSLIGGIEELSADDEDVLV